jgi:nitronate monooxygenase
MVQSMQKCTEKLGIQYPIIQAPMAGGATTPELVAAVSNAGGLGSLAAGYMSPDDIRKAIKRIRNLSKKPFLVNLFIPEEKSATPEQIQKSCHNIEQCSKELDQKIKPVFPPYMQPFEEQIQVLLKENVPFFSFTFGLLDPKWIKCLKSNKTLLIGTATTLFEAQALEESGVDMVVVQGSEAGGHRGTFLSKEEDALIDLFSLIPQCIEKLKIPVIAAGGIMKGADIVAALTSGAVAVQMGTAFLSCYESGIHNKYKEILLAQQQDNTKLTRAFSGKLARGIQNKFIDCMQTKPSSILDYPIQNALTKAMRKKAEEIDDTEFMAMWAGQAVALCRDISAERLVVQLIDEMNEIFNLN